MRNNLRESALQVLGVIIPAERSSYGEIRAKLAPEGMTKLKPMWKTNNIITTTIYKIKLSKRLAGHTGLSIAYRCESLTLNAETEWTMQPLQTDHDHCADFHQVVALLYNIVS